MCHDVKYLYNSVYLIVQCLQWLQDVDSIVANDRIIAISKSEVQQGNLNCRRSDKVDLCEIKYPGSSPIDFK